MNELNPFKLAKMLEELENTVELHSISVRYKGEKVVEGAWAPFSMEEPQMMHSLSKIGTSICVGFAVDEGKLHLGSNRILSAMNRRYTREHYLGLIEKLRRARPDIALSTDIIVGFPGETEEDFMDTYRLVEEVGYSQVFTFIYSKREGTPAAEMDDDTPREVIQERFDRLVDLVQRKAFEANQAELGATVPVLVEGTSKRDDSILAGKSPKNQTVHAPVPAGADATSLVGRIVPVTIEEARTWQRFFIGAENS